MADEATADADALSLDRLAELTDELIADAREALTVAIDDYAYADAAIHAGRLADTLRIRDLVLALQS